MKTRTCKSESKWSSGKDSAEFSCSMATSRPRLTSRVLKLTSTGWRFYYRLFLTFSSIEGLNISTHQEAPNTITVGSQFQHIVNVETNRVSSFCLLLNKSLLGFLRLPSLAHFRYLRWPAPITSHRFACLHDKICCNCHNGRESVLSKMARAWKARSTEPGSFHNELYKPRNR